MSDIKVTIRGRQYTTNPDQYTDRDVMALVNLADSTSPLSLVARDGDAIWALKRIFPEIIRNPPDWMPPSGGLFLDSAEIASALITPLTVAKEQSKRFSDALVAIGKEPTYKEPQESASETPEVGDEQPSLQEMQEAAIQREQEAFKEQQIEKLRKQIEMLQAQEADPPSTKGKGFAPTPG